MKTKNIALSIFLAIIIILGIWYFFFRNNQVTGDNGNSQTQQILFTREDCSHCQNVKKYITDNKVDEKISFQVLDAQTSSANADLLLKKAVACGIKTDQIGVPLYWNNGKCLVGDQEIIDYFKQQIAGK